MTRHALLPGRLLDVVSGELLEDRAVLVEGERIAAVVAAHDVPSDVLVHDLPDHTVLPGLVDCHAHLVGEEDSGHGYTELLTRTGAQEAMTGVRNARDTLRAGFTSVRDVGTYRAFVDVALRDAIDAGWTCRPADDGAPAPTSAAAAVAATSAGSHPTSEEHVPAELRVGVVDTVDDVRRAVRRILNGGADLIKLIATGAVMSDDGNPGVPELTEDQIRAAVEEAALHGAHVAAHAHGAEGIKRAVRGGVHSIEHGSLMDDEGVALMAEHGTWLVADIYDGDYIAEIGRRDGWKADVLRKNDETTVAQREAFAKCVAAGVRIAYGTDSGDLPARPQCPTVRLPRAPRADAAGRDPLGHGAGRRADGLAGPDRPPRARAVRRPGRGGGRPAARRPAAGGGALGDEGWRGRPR